MNFNHAMTKFERYLRQNEYSENTIKSYCQAIKLTLKNVDLDKLNQEQLDEIQLTLIKTKGHNGNRSRYASINLFCKVALERKDLYLKIPKPIGKNRDVLTSEQAEKLIEVSKSKNRCVHALIQTLYDCALRKSEAIKLNVEDVKFDTMELVLRDTKSEHDQHVAMTSRVAEAIKGYLLYGRQPQDKQEKALFLNKYGVRIGEHYVRNHLKMIAIETGLTKRVYPHMLRASCITHLLNQRVNPITVQTHARHNSFRQTMSYNRPTQQHMKDDIERVFVHKSELTDEDRKKAVIDRYVKGEITSNELHSLLDLIKPKQLKHDSDLRGYC